MSEAWRVVACLIVVLGCSMDKAKQNRNDEAAADRSWMLGQTPEDIITRVAVPPTRVFSYGRNQEVLQWGDGNSFTCAYIETNGRCRTVRWQYIDTSGTIHHREFQEGWIEKLRRGLTNRIEGNP